MARPKKTDALDLTQRVNLTAGAIERLTCRTDIKAQAFLRDSEVPGLRVRATNTGAKSFVFEAKLKRQTIRRTIGDVRTWNIEAARTEARKLAVMLDGGTDPRELERQQAEEKAAHTAAEAERATADALTVGDVWAVYLAERRPHWGEHHANDHDRLSKAGGQPAKRGTRGRGVTIAGPLHTLMGLRLRDLDAATVEAWAATEAKTRPTPARLAWRLLKVFLTWCGEQPQYADMLPAKNPAKTRRTRETLGTSKPKTDALLKEQLPAWFAAVRAVKNPTASAYLQALLLTGARPGELLALKWEDVNTQWRGLTLRDKVEGERVIPLTPYVWRLLDALPRRNGFVFATGRALSLDPTVIARRERRHAQAGKPAPAANDESHMSEPNSAHSAACMVAGIGPVTLHGLRRSFKSLTEWLEVPVGVVAQIQGHKPSATAEKHYTVRPLDLLRVHHERIEAWVLEQAGVTMPSASEATGLRVVA
jgi:integrase